MLRKFKISIDGKEYLVEMEEIGGVPQSIVPTPHLQAYSPVVAPPQPSAEPYPQAEVAQADSNAMTAPMPGKILKVLVNLGDKVSENQPLMILEAMKMENEVVAASTGQVVGVHISAGQVVNAGDPLITIG